MAKKKDSKLSNMIKEEINNLVDPSEQDEEFSSQELIQNSRQKGVENCDWTALVISS